MMKPETYPLAATERSHASRGALTADRLHQLLDYDPTTGVFRWKVDRSWSAVAGALAGVLDHSRGYIKIEIDGVKYAAHRLAWLYVHGAWPLGLIDHANGERNDNRIENLREATRQGNAANSRLYKNNTSGLKGAHWSKKDRAWRAQICIHGRTKYLGSFQTREEAHAAYQNAASAEFGDFASSGREP